MKFLCALLGSSLANRAEICDKNDIKCREKSDNKSMFILNNFNDWFQLNQPPVLLKWVGKEDSKAILRNYKQDPAFLVDDSCSVVFNNEMLIFGGHWNPQARFSILKQLHLFKIILWTVFSFLTYVIITKISKWEIWETAWFF